MDKYAVLKSYWGFDAFRPMQEHIIDAVLENRDALALLPTGGGKSLCYQIPALMREGFALVISPLIALMEDQVSGLKERGIKAMYFESDPKGMSLLNQMDNAIHGNYKVVFVSPERLNSPSFRTLLQQATISLIAVDEAHCISEWGHDFRPSYLKIGLLRAFFPEVPILALTASATPEVKKDIENHLELKSLSLFQDSFERPNIAYNIWKTEDKFNTVLQLINQYQGSSIIYCYSRRQTELLSEFINQQHHRSSFFHGGLLVSEKKQRLKAWQEGKITHMVATTAFGMGIDKSNVRLVIHVNLPESIENYYQETGRAGRDGKPARTFLLYYKGDLEEHKQKVLNQLPERKELEHVYKELCNFLQIAYGEGQEHPYSLNVEVFCKRYHRTEKKLHQCLVQLEKTGVLNWQVSQTKALRIKIKCSPDRALSFVENGSTSAKVMEYLMRKHPHLFTESVNTSIQTLCGALSISSECLLNSLTQLAQENLLDYTSSASTLFLSFQVPREDRYTLIPALSILQKLKAQKLEKLDALISFLKEDKKCKRNQILTYFGENKKTDCNQCSSISCKTGWDSVADFKSKVIELVKLHPHSIQELKQKLYFEPQALKMVFAELLEKEQIGQNSNQKFYWIDE